MGYASAGIPWGSCASDPLAADTRAKAAHDVPSTWRCLLRSRPSVSSCILTSAWCSLGCCGRVGSEPAGGRFLHLSLCVCLSSLSLFQIILRSSIHCFTAQMATKIRVGADSSQELGTPSGWHQVLDPSSAAFLRYIRGEMARNQSS